MFREDIIVLGVAKGVDHIHPLHVSQLQALLIPGDKQWGQGTKFLGMDYQGLYS